ncbi:MAG TPA: phosphoribosylformylglycinamidine synthase subunit PurS [Thermomicrobiales bacterium]|nr:phosphoribosylformylglycinamidine synthase subunit PurS [Thermomicrobiales bacterium]
MANVIVMPKEGVNDPEGEAILGGLHALGHDSVETVRAGRMLRLTVSALNETEAQAQVATMCDQLLANPVIESYAITIQPTGATVR